MNAFESTMARMAQRRAERREEFRIALDAGKTIRQLGSRWPACSPFVDVDSAYLASHIEAREHGFGFPTDVEQ